MSTSNLRNLNDRGQESVRALIQALAPEIATNGNLSSDEIANRLTDKLASLVGSEGLQGGNERRNERGELVNEEGLPIVEIAEPADPTDLRTSTSRPTPITVEPLIPLATLSNEAQTRLREKRNRILDFLEDEERQAEIAEKRREADERAELSRKKEAEAFKDQGRVREARDLQKKMGRALLQNLSKAKEQERQEQEVQRLRDEEADKKRSPSIKKKTVAFAESTEHIDVLEPKAEMSNGADWGDVSLGRLANTKRPTLMSQALLDRHPMKASVVERIPGGQATLAKPSLLLNQGGDSDDDSEPESVPSSSSTEGDEELELDSSEVDLDFARHQREIALEYYTKRNTIGQDAAHALEDSDHESVPPTDAPEVVQGSFNPAISHFKANRLASAYNASAPSSSGSQPQPVSLGASVLPASSTRTIQRAIRSGKLDDDGKLVGGDADSASEDGLQDVLELIRKGEVYNLGPNGEYLHTIPPNTNRSDLASSSQPASSSTHAVGGGSPEGKSLAPPSMRSKTSKFKASRAAAGRPSPSLAAVNISSPSFQEPRSSSVTPISHEGRSSPKMDTIRYPSDFSLAEGSASASRNQIDTRLSSRSSTPTSSTSTSSFSTLVASPSYPQANGSSSQMPSMIVESPSFPSKHPPSVSRPSAPPMIIESPSFPAGRGSRRPERPPTVISSVVREAKASTSGQNNMADDDDQRPKKVSRFKAERMS